VAFDWLNFLDSNNVDYIEQGKNVARGNVNVACPFCRDDPSHHMGISLSDGSWGCWRNSKHRGRKPEILVSRLMGWSLIYAREIVSEGKTTSNLDELSESLQDLGRATKSEGRVEEVSLPQKAISAHRVSYARNYLLYCGFLDAEEVSRVYGLRACRIPSRWAYRLIYPVYDETILVGWTARAITGQSKVRYMAHPTGKAIKNYLFNSQSATGGEVLVVVEGPKDALKVDWVGKLFDVSAVSLMGTSATKLQVSRLAHLASRYKRTAILLDEDAEAQALDLAAKLSFLGVESWRLPDGADDPGSLSYYEVAFMIEGNLS
jgi:hypothetical protein